MDRSLWLCALLALAPVGCHAKSYPLPSSSSGDDASDEGHGGGACACVLSSATGGTSLSIACGQTGCIDGTQYLCSGESLIALDSCGGDGGMTLGGDGSSTCTPVCTGRSCGNSDGCGGTCTCAGGLPCNTTSNTCGNGCKLIAGDPCAPDASASTNAALCCEDGYQCATDDGGYSGCCTTTSLGDAGLGSCTQDSDCCDYPNVHCGTNHLCQ